MSIRMVYFLLLNQSRANGTRIDGDREVKNDGLEMRVMPLEDNRDEEKLDVYSQQCLSLLPSVIFFRSLQGQV